MLNAACVWLPAVRPQVYAQPVFATAEDVMLRLAPKVDNFAGKEWLVRLGYR